MTVQELIKQLSTMNPDAVVVAAGDPEGNHYNKVWRVTPNALVVENPHSKYAGYETLLPVDIDDLAEDGEEIPVGTDAVVLAV